MADKTLQFLDIPRERVKLHDLLMGGGFGRRGNRDLDFIMDAVMLSKEVGRPVKGRDRGLPRRRLGCPRNRLF